MRSRVLKSLLIALACVASAQSSVTFFAFFLLNALVALRRPAVCLQCLVVSCLAVLINPTLTKDLGPAIGIGRWLIFGSVLVCLFRYRSSWRMKSPQLVSASFLLYLITAFGGSYAPLASLSKLLVFFCCLMLVSSLFELISSKDAQDILLISIIVVLFLSLITGLSPSVAFARNGTGFQGILSHPQTFGIFAAMAAPYLAYLGVTRKSALLGFLAVLCLSLLPLSEARTGFVTAILSCALVLVLNAKSVGFSAQGRALAFALIPILLGTSILFSDVVYEKGTTFLRKRQEKQDFSEALVSSRLRLVLIALEGFRRSPILGNGFGIPSNERAYQSKVKDEAKNLSLSTEKGVLYPAILDETGIVGVVAFLLLLTWLVMPILINKIKSGAILLFAFLTVNLGEAIFFSFGAIGFWCWLLVLSTRIQRDNSSD